MTENNIPIPTNVVGQVGMVAMLQRVRPGDDGKLVVVRRPIGIVTSLVGSKNPVFGWEVLVLGEPVLVNQKPCREIYVADKCLKPVSHISAEQVEVFVKARAKEDFDAAMAELATILGASSMTPDAFEGYVEKAASQFGVERALEKVPTSVALTEVGFKRTQPDGECLDWVGVNNGVEIKITAGPDWFGHWTLLGTSIAQRQAMCSEIRIVGEASRGETVAKVLGLWREAFGSRDTVPDSLKLGVVFEEHQDAMKCLNPGLPHLNLDAVVFRSTVKWLRHRQEGYGNHSRLFLSFSDGLMKLRVCDTTYGCPAYGVWTDDCQVMLGDLLTIEPWCLRGNLMRLDRADGYITFNGHQVGVI